MVLMKDQRFSSLPGENEYAQSMRAFIESTRPYAGASVMFPAYTPPASNTLDTMAPMILAVALLGFFLW